MSDKVAPWPGPPDSADLPRPAPSPDLKDPTSKIGRLVLHVMAITAVLLALVAALDGFLNLLELILIAPLWLIVGVVWTTWVIWRVARSGRTVRFRDVATWSVIPILLVAAVAVVASGLLVTSRFQLSETDLDALADRIQAGEGIRGPQTAGLFVVEGHWTGYDGDVYLVIGRGGFIDDIALGRDPSDDFCQEMQKLDERWSLCYLHI